MEDFPYEWKPADQFDRDPTVFDCTFNAVQSSMRLLARFEDEHALFNLAILVEHARGNGR